MSKQKKTKRKSFFITVYVVYVPGIVNETRLSRLLMMMMMMMMTQVIILNLLHKNKIYKILKSSIYWITCHLTVKNDNIILCRRRCTYHKHLGFCTVQLKNRMLLLSQLVLEDRMLHDDTYVANERCADIKWMARSSTFCQFRCL